MHFRFLCTYHVVKYYFISILGVYCHDQHKDLLIFMILFEVMNIKMTWEWLYRAGPFTRPIRPLPKAHKWKGGPKILEKKG